MTKKLKITYMVASMLLAIGVGIGIGLEISTRNSFIEGELVQEMKDVKKKMKPSSPAVSSSPIVVVRAGGGSSWGTPSGKETQNDVNKQKAKPDSSVPHRAVYYPGTETLSKGEIRLTACGTGTTDARRGQASTCWLVEVGDFSDGCTIESNGVQQSYSSGTLDYEEIINTYSSKGSATKTDATILKSVTKTKISQDGTKTKIPQDGTKGTTGPTCVSKFLFDVGTGSMVNVAALMIPYDFLDKVFLTHLHTDHWGDLDALWVNRWTGGATLPLNVWGPSGYMPSTATMPVPSSPPVPTWLSSFNCSSDSDESTDAPNCADYAYTKYEIKEGKVVSSKTYSKMGTQYAIDMFLQAFNWDNTTRGYTLSAVPGQINVTEFDYTIPHKADDKPNVIYTSTSADQSQIITIESWPAIHTGNGSVSYSLEYKYKNDDPIQIVIGGDTYPNKWYIKQAQNAHIAIHEVYETPTQLVTLSSESAAVALSVGTGAHTSGPAFGKVMSCVKPGLAIGYHFPNNAVAHDSVYQNVRTTYNPSSVQADTSTQCSDTPMSSTAELTLALDNMVWNITQKQIVERMVVSSDNPWAVPGPIPMQGPAKSNKMDKINPFSINIQAGKWNPQAQLAQRNVVCDFIKNTNPGVSSKSTEGMPDTCTYGTYCTEQTCPASPSQ